MKSLKVMSWFAWSMIPPNHSASSRLGLMARLVQRKGKWSQYQHAQIFVLPREQRPRTSNSIATSASKGFASLVQNLRAPIVPLRKWKHAWNCFVELNKPSATEIDLKEFVNNCKTPMEKVLNAFLSKEFVQFCAKNQAEALSPSSSRRRGQGGETFDLLETALQPNVFMNIQFRPENLEWFYLAQPVHVDLDSIKISNITFERMSRLRYAATLHAQKVNSGQLSVKNQQPFISLNEWPPFFDSQGEVNKICITLETQVACVFENEYGQAKFDKMVFEFGFESVVNQEEELDWSIAKLTMRDPTSNVPIGEFIMKQNQLKALEQALKAAKASTDQDPKQST